LTTSTTPTVPGLRFSGDYSIEKLVILTAAGAIDLKNMMVELSYNEDIFSNTINGYLMIGDSMGYIELLNLLGNEFMRVSFKKAEDWRIIDKIVRVYKVDKRRLENNMNTETYSLYFCSEEAILNEQYKICKAYPGKTISDNIYSILTSSFPNGLGVDTQNIAQIEPTYGKYDFVVPTIKPFDAINWMASYARPTPDKPGADMLFFENADGFFFRSLQSMMADAPYANFAYNPKNTNRSDLNLQMFNVLTYEILNSYDKLGETIKGTFANQLISVDILTRQTKVTPFDYADYFNNATNMNKFPLANQFQNRFGHQVNQPSRGVQKLVFSNFSQKTSQYVDAIDTSSVANDIYAETYIPYRTAQLSLVNAIRLKISVPGDTTLRVGTTIMFSLNSLNPTQKELDKFYSGKYLITAVRHLINTSEYRTILEISKESVSADYANPDNSASIWKNTVAGKTIV